MKKLLYIGNFYPWKEKNEDELFEALQTFDHVKICVMLKGKKLKKGQPSKTLAGEMKDKISICKFKRMKNLFNVYKDYKYIMFER